MPYHIYPSLSLIDEKTALEAARRTEAAGIPRFSFVTSGRKLSPREVRDLAQLVRAVRRETSVEVCVSAGLLKEEELRLLRDAGVVRYHCNLEASPDYFPKVCSSHTTKDKIDTLLAARRAGLDLCSGGIVGMGETPADRIDLALTLRELDLPSVPLNLLAPIPGTPLESTPLLSEEDFLRTVAVFRFLLPKAHLRFAGGRARLSEETVRKALEIGITSAIAGDLLTTVGSSVEEDKKRVREAGYTNVFTPFAQLYHYESKSRGLDESPAKRKRFASEVERFQKRWAKQLAAGDPCMNPNFDLMKEDFSFDIKPLE